jgi:trehalose/maltose hydrolase-like predicted phosphorylase
METDGAHIRDVIGPDEYHIHVDDSFYTNLLAAWQLRRAGEAAEWLAASYPDAHARLLSRLAITTEDLAGFRRAADRVVLRRRNDGVWEQHAGFFDLEALDLDRFEPRLHTMYDLLGEELLGRVAVIKQADVLMGLALLPEHAGGAEGWRANWEYYAPKADHGSSLSLSFHAMAACRLGEVATATELFRKAISIDLADSMGNGRDGIHAACQGGILQTAIFGFGGLSLEGGAPVLHPRLPDHWESFAFSFAHRGEVFDRELAR